MQFYIGLALYLSFIQSADVIIRGGSVYLFINFVM